MRTTRTLVDESLPHRSTVDASFVYRYQFFDFIQLKVKFSCIMHSDNTLRLINPDDEFTFIHAGRFDKVCNFRVENLNHETGQPNSKFSFLFQQKFV